jgi:hypothetical protein
MEVNPKKVNLFDANDYNQENKNELRKLLLV